MPSSSMYAGQSWYCKTSSSAQRRVGCARQWWWHSSPFMLLVEIQSSRIFCTFWIRNLVDQWNRGEGNWCCYLTNCYISNNLLLALKLGLNRKLHGMFLNIYMATVLACCHFAHIIFWHYVIIIIWWYLTRIASN